MRLLILLPLLILAGCQSTSNLISGHCQVRESNDTFTNKAQVNFTSCNVAGSENVWDIPPHRFNFTWYEAYPERVRFGIAYSSSVSGRGYTNFESIRINIDGNRVLSKEFSDTIFDSSSYNEVTNDISTTSRASISIDIELLERMLNADDVRMRVNTSDGYSDYVFHIAENGMSRYAKADLPKFIAAIDKYR